MENTTVLSSNNRFLCFFTEIFLYNIIACQDDHSQQEGLFLKEEKEDIISQ